MNIRISRYLGCLLLFSGFCINADDAQASKICPCMLPKPPQTPAQQPKPTQPLPKNDELVLSAITREALQDARIIGLNLTVYRNDEVDEAVWQAFAEKMVELDNALNKVRTDKRLASEDLALLYEKVLTSNNMARAELSIIVSNGECGDCAQDCACRNSNGYCDCGVKSKCCGQPTKPKPKGDEKGQEVQEESQDNSTVNAAVNVNATVNVITINLTIYRGQDDADDAAWQSFITKLQELSSSLGGTKDSRQQLGGQELVDLYEKVLLSKNIEDVQVSIVFGTQDDRSCSTCGGCGCTQPKPCPGCTQGCCGK